MPKTLSPHRPVEQPSSPRAINLEATATIHLEAAGSDGATPLPRFRMVAYTGAPMRVAGWRHPVVLDLAGIAIPSQARPIRFGHDPLAGVGHTDAVRVEDGQLVATGIVSRDTPAAREVVTSAKNGFPWQASVGASVEEFEFVKENQQVLVNGQTLSGPLNVVRKATLGEISFVDLGADGRTSASVAANQNTGDTSVPNETETDSELTAEEVRARAVAETNRIAAIRRICAGTLPELEARAIREGWDETRTELEKMRITRPTSPIPHGGSHTPVNARMLEAACLLTAKLDNVERMVDTQTLEMASQRFRGGIGLQELLLEAAWANGYTGRNFRDSRAVLRYAFGRGIEAGFSTVDIGGLLSNVANKFLLDGFFSVERTWRNVCAVRNVSDFKTVTSYRLVGNDQYEQVPAGGELKHGTLGNETYSNKADTHGLMLSIDRRDIINDDLGAITTVPRKLGRGSGLKINDVFWSIFMANSAFFVAGNGNYIVGAGTALGIDGLTAGEVKFLDQVDGDGKPIGVMPAILLVPTALSAI
ncbi:MAG: hypothetical protein FJ304_25945, partial [Planctomycetes bacterium]|nr:hypothetical protein [Planctomycetota bacterium]